VSGAIASARELLASRSAADLLRDAAPPMPIIAGRHTQATGILRYFDAHYVDVGTPVELPPSSADGSVLFMFGDGDAVTTTGDGRPVVCARSRHSRGAGSGSGRTGRHRCCAT